MLLLLYATFCKGQNVKSSSSEPDKESKTVNIMLEVSLPDLLVRLAGYNDNVSFRSAVNTAKEQWKPSGAAYIDLFYKAWRKLEGDNMLASIFASYDFSHEVSVDTPDNVLIELLKEKTMMAVKNTFNILRSRLDRHVDRVHRKHIAIQLLKNTGYIRIRIPQQLNTDRLHSFLTNAGKLELWETYNATELLNVLEYVNETFGVSDGAEDSTAKDHLSFFSIFTLPVNEDNALCSTACIGRSYAGDTAKVAEMLSRAEVRNVLPVHIRFMWTAKPDSDNLYELIGIRVTSRTGGAWVDGSMVVDAIARQDEQSSGWEVLVAMSEEGSRNWAHLTAGNAGKAIAVALDGKAYSYFTVSGEDKTGTLTISTGLTKEEAEDIAVMLKSGELPALAKIIEEK